MELNYEQLSKMDVKNYIQAAIKNAEQQHLECLINITVNETSAKLMEKAGKSAEASRFKHQATLHRIRSESLLKSVELLKDQFKENLSEAIDTETAKSEEPSPIAIK